MTETLTPEAKLAKLRVLVGNLEKQIVEARKVLRGELA